MSNTSTCLAAIKSALSPARISTYENAIGTPTADDSRAVALYAWNAQVSAALFTPLHICEVVVRNAVSEALEIVHGPHWPQENGFIASLPSVPPGRGYSPRNDLRKVSSEQPTTGKIIPELKFAFWEQMFTRRHDDRLWDAHIKRVFPAHPSLTHTWELRRRIYGDLEILRKLRNRIAHHEPIFTRRLSEDFARMVELVSMRSPLVASWMVASQQASHFISQAPIFCGGKLWTPSHEEIQLQAHQLWIAGGCRNDTAEADWFAARQLLGIY